MADERNVTTADDGRLDMDESASVEDGEGDLPNSVEESSEENNENNKEQNLSHLRNADAHPRWLRYGIPLYLCATCGLLLASDVGSGVEANYILRASDGSVFEEKTLLTASIFSSVVELWDTGSYALAIFIVITSICWPYLKIILSLGAWTLHVWNSGTRREHLIEIVDALGKWSFVDIFVLLIIMVAFRSTIPVASGASIDVVIVPQWGFYGFVLATMLSLVGTHVILYRHRLVLYEPDDSKPTTTAQDEEQSVEVDGGGEDKTRLVDATNIRIPLLITVVVIGLTLHIVGSVVDIYQITETDNRDVTLREDYSFIRVGRDVSEATLDESDVGIRWIQAMYFALGFALPIWNGILWVILYVWPMNSKRQERFFFAAEISFSWSAMEVFVLSAVFAVIQVPEFGNGLIDAGCDQCYVVGSSIKPEIAILAVASVWNVLLSMGLYRKAHQALHPSADPSDRCSLCSSCWRWRCMKWRS